MQTINPFNNLTNNELTTFGDYAQPWKLDSGSNGNYCGPGTGVRNQRKNVMA